MPIFPISTSRTVLNPVRVQEWNVSIRRGDDFAIALTVYDDDGLTPAEVYGAESRLYLRPDGCGERLHWDYGRGWIGDSGYSDSPVDMITRDGVVLIGSYGRIDFVLTAAETVALMGRYRLLLQVALPSGRTTQIEGILQTRAGGASMAALAALALPPEAFGIGAFNPPLGGPGFGLFDNVGFFSTGGGGPPIITPPIIVPPVAGQAILGQAVLGQFRLG